MFFDASTRQLRLHAIGMVMVAGISTASAIEVGNYVWNDLNGNGRQDAAEPGQASVVVQLWNSAKNSLLAQTTTNASGAYSLTAAGPGNFRIRVVLPDSEDQFSGKDLASGNDTLDSDINPSGADIGFTDIFTLTTGVDNPNLDAGIIRPLGTREIGDRVFLANADGTQGTANLAGVTVQLLDSSNAVLTSTTSDSTGFYSLDATPASYRLRFLAPAGFSPCPKDAGGNDANDSDIDSAGLTDLFTLGVNEVRTNLDAGFFEMVKAGDRVWHDADADGRQDSNERGIPGVVVQHWNSAKSQLIAQQTTTAWGGFSFDLVVGISYRIRIVLPNVGDQFTLKDVAGVPEAEDSDFSPSGSNLGFTDILTFASGSPDSVLIDGGIRLANPPTLDPFRILSATASTATSWNVTFVAPIGDQYALDRSTNLQNWVQAVSPFVTTTGQTTKSVPIPAGQTRHFFRVRQVR